MEPGDDEARHSNLATTLASIAIDAGKLMAGVPLDYPDPLLTPLATVPQPAKEEAMDDVKDEKDKPMLDQMTDVVAAAAGELARTAVQAVAKRAKKTVVSNTPAPVKRAAKAVAKAAKAPKKTAKKAAKKAAKKTVKKAKKGSAKKTKKAAPKKSKKTAKKTAKKSKKSKR
jgi:uncharacterized protein YjgD (DUF1641 family)